MRNRGTGEFSVRTVHEVFLPAARPLVVADFGVLFAENLLRKLPAPRRPEVSLVTWPVFGEKPGAGGRILGITPAHFPHRQA